MFSYTVHQKFLNQDCHSHWIHHLSAVDQHLHCCHHHHSLVQQALMSCHWGRMRLVSPGGDGGGGGDGDGGGDEDGCDTVDEGGVDSHS